MVVVNVKLIVDFLVISLVCVDDLMIIIFMGIVGVMVIYDWLFDGGIIVSGFGVGFYEVSWDILGDKNISFMVIENGCVSDLVIGIVIVDVEIL